MIIYNYVVIPTIDQPKKYDQTWVGSEPYPNGRFSRQQPVARSCKLGFSENSLPQNIRLHPSLHCP